LESKYKEYKGYTEMLKKVINEHEQKRINYKKQIEVLANENSVLRTQVEMRESEYTELVSRNDGNVNGHDNNTDELIKTKYDELKEECKQLRSHNNELTEVVASMTDSKPNNTNSKNYALKYHKIKQHCKHLESQLKIHSSNRNDTNNAAILIARNNSLSQVTQENIELKQTVEHLKKQLNASTNIPNGLPYKKKFDYDIKSNDNINNNANRNEQVFFCETCKKRKALSTRFVYSKCKDHHCIQCAETILLADVLKDKPLKCFKCGKKTIVEDDLKNISTRLIEAYHHKKKLALTKKCLTCDKVNPLSKWKVKRYSYQCPQKHCDYEFCYNCHYSMNQAHSVLGCATNKLLYEDSKHHIFCPKGHLSINQSDWNPKQQYKHIKKCSNKPCCMYHCYTCSKSFKGDETHVCPGSLRDTMRITTQITKFGGLGMDFTK